MNSFYERVGRAEAVIAGVFLILMVLAIFIGGASRYLRYPINGTTDIATCLFAWSCFLSADLAWRNNGLMAIEFVMDRMPRSGQRALTLFNYALIAAFLLFLSTMGFYLSWISRARSFQGIPWISYSWVTLSLAVGALLLLWTCAIKIASELRGENTRAGDVADIL